MIRPLYELAADYSAILARLDAAESAAEVAEVLEISGMDAISGDIRTKTENIAKMVRHLGAIQDMCSDEEAKLKRRREVATRAEERLKHYLLFCLERAQMDRVEAGPFVVTKSPSPLKFTEDRGADLWAADLRFIREVPATHEWDKDALLAAHKAGEALPPGISFTTRNHVRIR